MCRKIFWVFRSFPKILILKIKYRKKIKLSFLLNLYCGAKFRIYKGKLCIGEGCHIKHGVEIDVRRGGTVMIGKHVCINTNSHISSLSKVTIGDCTAIAQNVIIVDHDHDFRAEGGIRDDQYKIDDVFIGKGVWIGANSVILRGTVIGDNSVVGAGTIVSGKFENGSIITQKRTVVTRNIYDNVS